MFEPTWGTITYEYRSGYGTSPWYGGSPLGIHIATPVFDGASSEDLWDTVKEAGMDSDAKTIYTMVVLVNHLITVSVGVMYMIKLHHMVDDNCMPVQLEPYSIVTQQPLGGKAQFGGQRFGEMEVWKP